MNRIEARFKDLQGRKALIPFITAGDPHPDMTVPMMHALVKGGADIIELGVPFSDPMADGPVIQRASERALKHRTSLKKVLAMVRRFREEDPKTPVILMGYLNPIEVMGYAPFAEAAGEAGADGVLAVDMPPEEEGALYPELLARGLDPIFLLAPTTAPERMRMIAKKARGFIYYVSLKGVTGSDRLDVGEVAERLAVVRHYTRLPIGVGFGIRDAASAAAVGKVADAVIVGSALVRLVESLLDTPERIPAALAETLQGMRQALDRELA